MAIKRQDEVLAKAAATDATVIPRYDIKRPDGTKVAENVALELKNTVVSQGTAINKQLLDEILAASGTAGGTASALTLAQDGFVLADGAEVRIKTSAFDIGAGATLNVNGTGAKNIITPAGEEFAGSLRAGVWLVLIYSAALDGYVVVSKTMKTVTEIFTSSGTWTCPAGVTSIHVQVFGAGGAGGAGGDGAGGGGGAGGHMKSSTLSVTPGITYTITVGTGGKATTTTGGTGGPTSFSSLLSADGGTGGSISSAGSGGTGGGGPGGNGANGGTGSYGGNGGKGKRSTSDSSIAGDGIAAAGGDGAAGTAGSGAYGGGAGGGGFGGKGGNGGNGTTSLGGGGGGGGGYGVNGNGGNGGNSGTNNGVVGGTGAGGGGGGAGAVGSSNGAGGNGGNGAVIITYVVEA